MKFGIITPSYNMLDYLKNCHSSVIDQKGVELEHCVVDGGSSDGTASWIKQTMVTGVSEADNGMYDAINKGLNMVDADIYGYLNCDEQYLPGTLEKVAEFFDSNPDIDMVFGNMLLIKPDGQLLAYRKCYPPRWSYIYASHLYVPSCTMFFRKRVLDSGILFNSEFRAVGDADFVIRVLQKGFKAGCIKDFLSAFVMTGKNLSSDEKSVEEERVLFQKAPVWVKIVKPFLNFCRLLEKFFNGCYRNEEVINYQVFSGGTGRSDFNESSATQKWSWG